ncbi:MAG: GTP 3',8-cyclase MoaA [Thermoanaerobaculia bacterium]|nr:GTP 3',8-cyclase MoaA [Thermoanaerobaculia bacterium]
MALVSELRDQLDRPITDLRISVTDRCNFRCTFCMPAEQEYEFLRREEILDYEEVTRLARVFVSLGVEKIRLTGGEPLIRRDLTLFVEMLREIPGIRDLALTTNGMLLPRRAEELAEAGVDRVTVSLPTLDPETFTRTSGGRGDLHRVLEGIEAAIDAGLVPVKINAVILRDVNDHEILEMAERFRRPDTILRFIEYMDVGTLNRWDPSKVVPAREIRDRIEEVHPLEPIGRRRPQDPATRYRYRDGEGQIGIIASVTEPFCGDCTRARLSAEGSLYTCLFASEGHDLKTPLRSGATDEELGELLREIWSSRTDRYSEERLVHLETGRDLPERERVEMFRVGG